MKNLQYERLAVAEPAPSLGARLSGIKSTILTAVFFALLNLVETSSAAAEPRVVVTIKPVHALVAQVMKGVGEPLLLVDGAGSPHSFALRPSQSSAISRADVFVRVSAQVEPFTVRLQSILPAGSTVVTLADAEGVRLLSRRDGAHFEHDGHHHHSLEDDHDEAIDGHIWLDTKNARAIVRSTEKVLSDRFPEFSTDFKTNAGNALTKIDALENRIAERLTPVKAGKFVVFHDAYQYFEDEFGLRALGSIVVDPQISPSGAWLSEIRKVIKQQNVSCVFGEPQTSTAIVTAVTEGLNVRYGELDAVGLTIPAGPEAYDRLMEKLSASILSCLASQE